MAWHFFTPNVTPSIGTALPSNPVDGQEFTLVDSLSAPTYAWRLRYIAAKASNKWQFIGGSSIEAEVATSESRAVTAYGDLATVGPSIALPIAGDYFVEIGYRIASGGADTSAIMSYDIGGTAAVDADAAQAGNVGAGGDAGMNSVIRTKKKSGLTAITLTSKYRCRTAVSINFADRWIRVTPIALGG